MSFYKVPVFEQFPWQLPVKSASTNVPTSPNKGDRYLIPSNATGVWESHRLDIATRTDSTWEYKVRTEGLICWVEDTDKIYIYTGTVWTEISKSADNNFYLGDSLLNDKAFIARTNQTYCPTIKYDATALKWKISNGGTSETWTELGQSGLFDVNIDGDLEPQTDGIVDDVYELDGNNDIQPKA